MNGKQLDNKIQTLIKEGFSDDQIVDQIGGDEVYGSPEMMAAYEVRLQQLGIKYSDEMMQEFMGSLNVFSSPQEILNTPDENIKSEWYGILKHSYNVS